MKLANEIQKHLIDFARGSAYDIVLCNYYFGSYEMDVFKLNDKCWITEYEIKISRADFKKDFSKQRQQVLYHDKSYLNYTLVTTNKHEQLNSGDCKPNRFYFVVPKDLITIDEIPKHCGLIYYNIGKFETVKSAKLLHKNPQPADVYKSIARSLSFRELRYRREKDYYQYEVKQLNKELDQLNNTKNILD